MENKVEVAVAEGSKTLLTWETPTVVEYDAKSEILGPNRRNNPDAIFGTS